MLPVGPVHGDEGRTETAGECWIDLQIELKEGTGEFEVSGRDKKAALAVVVGSLGKRPVERAGHDPRGELAAIRSSGGNTLYLVAWIAGADRSSVYYAMLDRSGVVRVPATEITIGSGGEYGRLEVRPGSGTQARILASYATSAGTVVREFAVGSPTADDCDGDGISDALAIAAGAASDCNGNGRPDACDIRLGTSQDRDYNGVPDEFLISLRFALSSLVIVDGRPRWLKALRLRLGLRLGAGGEGYEHEKPELRTVRGPAPPRD